MNIDPTQPLGTRTNPHRDVHFQVDQDRHLVAVDLRPGYDDADWEAGRVYSLLTPRAALEIAQKLTQSALHAFELRERDLRLGDCQHCKNLRLVDEETNGRTQSVYCTVCMGDQGKPKLPAIPTLPFLYEQEAEAHRHQR